MKSFPNEKSRKLERKEMKMGETDVSYFKILPHEQIEWSGRLRADAADVAAAVAQ